MPNRFSWVPELPEPKVPPPERGFVMKQRALSARSLPVCTHADPEIVIPVQREVQSARAAARGSSAGASSSTQEFSFEAVGESIRKSVQIWSPRDEREDEDTEATRRESKVYKYKKARDAAGFTADVLRTGIDTIASGVDKTFDATGITKLADTFDEGLRPGAKASNMLNEQLYSTVFKTVGNLIKKAALPPYMPQAVHRRMEPAVAEGWSYVQQALLEDIHEQQDASPRARAYREMRTKFWANPPRRICSWTWLRAKLLYALYPADGNVWKTFASPFSAVVFLLKMHPATSVPAFVLTFFLIDRSDEYQLVRFVLNLKGFQFVSSGLVSSVILALTQINCLGAEARGDFSACLDAAPGHSDLYIYNRFPLEPVRIGLVHYAAWLLTSGHAFGGHKELEALENFRIDAADGAPDGEADRALLRAQKVRAQSIVDLDGKQLEDLTAEDILEGTAKHRDSISVTRQTGGYLGYFMAYDAAVVGLDFFLFVLAVPLWAGAYMELDNPMFWTCLYFFRLTYALSAWPFLAFALPVVGPLLHKAKPTGYDQSGALVPQLSAALMRQKIDNDKVEALEKKKFAHMLVRETSRLGGDANRAAEKIQKRVRGRMARANVLADITYFSGGFLAFTRQGLRTRMGEALPQ